MKKLALALAIIASPVLAGDAPADPDITIKLSELQALINFAVAQHEASVALAKVQAQAAPKPPTAEAHSPSSTPNPLAKPQ